MPSINWELIIAAILVWFGLKAIAEALEILATRIAAHTEIVRLATAHRPHLQAVSSPHKPPTPPTGMGPRWETPK